MATLRFLYRGPLESCNYGCVYCPFAKRVDSREDLARDKEALTRFVRFIQDFDAERRVGILITPWGEGLIRRWYQDALVSLASVAHVERASIQTNLSCDLGWAERVPHPSRVALWATFHPEWTDREKFIAKVRRLKSLGIGVSCGVVGFNKFATDIERLREALPSDVYLWINAAKKAERYTEETIRRFERIDPLFRTNTVEHPSLGRMCRAGQSVVSVEGESGDVRRCHFVDQVIGNLYDGTFGEALRERACPNKTCGCHIGYVHLDDLDLYRTYGANVLERIPSEPVWRRSLTVVS